MELERRFRTRVERFEHGHFSAEILLPESSEDLIDEREFGADERLPYWAELWPSALALTRHLLDAPVLPEAAIELGAGVGLPSLALRARGVDVTATDYYPEALDFARVNAQRNGFPPLQTLVVDWRTPPADLRPAPLVVAADVLYEDRNVAALAGILARAVAPDGVAIIADPGRSYFTPFIEVMSRSGWQLERYADRHEASPAGGGRRITVNLIGIRRSRSAHDG